MLSDNASAFKELKTCGNQIETEMQGLKSIIENSIASVPFPVSSFEVKEVNHFIYFSKNYDQFIMSGTHPANLEHLEELPKEHYQILLNRYNLAYSLSETTEYYKGNYIKIDVYRNEQIICLRQQEYFLLASMSSLLSTTICIQACTQLLKLLKQEESTLFIPK